MIFGQILFNKNQLKRDVRLFFFFKKYRGVCRYPGIIYGAFFHRCTVSIQQRTCCLNFYYFLATARWFTSRDLKRRERKGSVTPKLNRYPPNPITILSNCQSLKSRVNLIRVWPGTTSGLKMAPIWHSQIRKGGATCVFGFPFHKSRGRRKTLQLSIESI